ncbi:SWIM-type domain-containing protein [Aphis craccivora]|uniref:SWIM-type domain-containing protein n=1 Tax=Aphis craccivora TaxID=307492 RepID=A0A6G0VKX8_APHCR|nr:SWIM-type domain-containing protein [Aphis craccivora]
MNNVIYFNICKHIHACAKQKNNISLPCKPAVTSTTSTYELADDNGFLQPNETQPKLDENTDNTGEITNKLESILGMVNRTKLNDIDQKYIIKQCDKIISKLAKNTDFKNTSNVGKKRNIEPQARFFYQQKKKN